MKIIANHAHLIPDPTEKDWWPKADAGKLLAHLDFCGIDKAVIFAPFACQMNGERIKANRWALDQASAHPDRFIVAGNLFPAGPDALEILNILSQEGVKTAKVHPSVDLYDVSDPMASDCYARAEELGIALDFHTGPHGTRLSLAKPEKYDDMAWDYPQLRMVFEHVGGRPYFEEFVAVLENHRGRAFGGLTSMLDGEEDFAARVLPRRIEELVNYREHSFIFGLDFPYHSPEVNKRDIEIIMGLSISREQKEKILGGNLAGLIGL